jgi:polyhydroxybutyrate depolymerase
LYLRFVILNRAKYLSFYLLFVLTLLCKSQTGIFTYDSIYSDGLYRKFRLYVPNIYNSSNAVPLILNLHGYTSNSAQQQAYANFMPIADTANFIVVSPDGTAPLGSPFWNAGFLSTGVNDVQFLSNLIDSIKANYNINLNRVYSCGMSNGGIMSYYLACNLPYRITAIASVTGTMLKAWSNCVPNRPFPIMQIHGTADATVPYVGNSTFEAIDSVVKKWQVYNLCSPASITYSVPNINLFDNSTAVRYVYSNGLNNTSVELFKVTNGSHSWPGGAPVIANTNQDFSASIEIWRFFRQYQLNQFTTVNELSELSSDRVFFGPNPTNGLIKLQQDAMFSIYNSLGVMLISGSGQVVDLSSLPAAVYFLEFNLKGKSFRSKIIKY